MSSLGWKTLLSGGWLWRKWISHGAILFSCPEPQVCPPRLPLGHISSLTRPSGHVRSEIFYASLALAGMLQSCSEWPSRFSAKPVGLEGMTVVVNLYAVFYNSPRRCKRGMPTHMAQQFDQELCGHSICSEDTLLPILLLSETTSGTPG